MIRRQRLDPSAVAPASRKVGALVDAGRLDEVRHELDRQAAVSRRFRALMRCLRSGNRRRLCRRSCPQRQWRVGIRNPYIGATALLAVVYARLGRREDAERVVAGAIPVAENVAGLSHMHHAQFYIGSALGVLGRYDEAVRWLTKAANEGYQSYPRFSTDQSLASLKGHAGFAALLERLRQDRDRWQKTL